MTRLIEVSPRTMGMLQSVLRYAPRWTHARVGVEKGRIGYHFVPAIHIRGKFTPGVGARTLLCILARVEPRPIACDPA